VEGADGTNAAQHSDAFQLLGVNLGFTRQKARIGSGRFVKSGATTEGEQTMNPSSMRAGMIRRYPEEATPFFALRAWNVYAGNSYHTLPLHRCAGARCEEKKARKLQLFYCPPLVSGSTFFIEVT